MSIQKTIENYRHGGLLEAIEAALLAMGKSKDSATVADLGPVDEFHIGGRAATSRVIARLELSADDVVLDIGCGLGGAARFVASEVGCRVRGIDLSAEYIEVGKALNQWLGLDGSITLDEGSATELPFDPDSFDHAYMLHVGMNIEDKEQLFADIARVLKPGGLFAIYDVMATSDEGPSYPVPWASEAAISHLASPEDYAQSLTRAGFDVESRESRRDFALEFFKEMKAKSEANGGPPPLGLHTLMQKTTPTRIGNMLAAIAGNAVAPFEMVARKRL